MTPTDVQVFIRSEIAQEMYDYLKQRISCQKNQKMKTRNPWNKASIAYWQDSAGMEYKKAYGFVLHECMGLFGIEDTVRNF